ncbi:MAG: MFS transporter [Candidatus Thorarchaeota archaeon]|nr:MFS transporter [Candidatus Thorarchaeota archaeon]
MRKGGMHQVVMLAFSLAVLQVGFGIVTPIFPFYVLELGVGGAELGVLASSFALTRIAFSSPMGGLSDNMGRKPVLLMSLLGFAFANVAYAFAQDIFIMIAARALEGAVSAGFFPAANAFVSDMTTPENRGTAMGYLSMGNMVGFVVGPTVGGVLAQLLGIRLPFIVAAVASLGTLLSIYILVGEPEVKTSWREQTRGARASLRSVLSRHPKAYLALGVSTFADMFAIGILEVAFMLDAVKRFSLQPIDIGVFFGLIGVIVIVGSVAFGKTSDVYGRKLLIVLGTTLVTISMVLFIVSADIRGILIGGGVLATGMSMRGPSNQALIGDLTEKQAYGNVMGLYGAVTNSAYAVSPLLAGVLLDRDGTSYSALLLGASVSLLGVLTTSLLLPRRVVSQSSQTNVAAV